MNKEIKLQCPLCRAKFTTTRRNKVWCSSICRDGFANAKQGLDENKRKQEMFLNPNYDYILERDVFKIKLLYPNYKSKINQNGEDNHGTKKQIIQANI